MQTLGVNSLTDAELLSVVLGTGVREKESATLGAHHLAETLIHRFGNLSSILSVPSPILKQLKGIGDVKSARLNAIGELLRRTRQPVAGHIITTAEDASSIFSNLRDCDREELWVALLNQRNELLDKRQVGVGGADSCSVSPREVVRFAVKYDCVRLIVAHNHPSGDPKPSPEDIRFTQAICRASRTVGIRFLDHLILGRDRGFFSFAREGYLTPKEKPPLGRLSSEVRPRINLAPNNQMVHLALRETV